jgi:hypothetical protein
VTIGGIELPAVRRKDLVAQEDGLAEKIMVDFHDFTGESGRYPDILIQFFNLAGGIFKPAKVQAFMRGSPRLPLPPPGFQGFELHARLEVPSFEMRQSRMVAGLQLGKKSTLFHIYLLITILIFFVKTGRVHREA